MRNHLVRSLALMVPTILGISIIVFAVIRLIPGDAVSARLDVSARLSPEDVVRIREELGLDGPVHEQYLRWAGAALRGDFGRSFVNARPVSETAMRRVPITLELALLAIAFALLMGVPLGVFSALRQDTAADHAARILGILTISVPHFVLGTMFIVLVSIWFRWQPPPGFRSILEDPSVHFQQILPAAIILGTGVGGVVMRMTRSSMLNVLRDDFVRTARSKGLNAAGVVWRHALPNALIPVVSLTSTSFALLLGGVVIIETIFAIPGLGQLTVTSVASRDYPQIIVNVLLLSFGIITVNFLTDVVYSRLDPRIRFS